MLQVKDLISNVEGKIDELEVRLENCHDDDSFYQISDAIDDLCEMLDWLYSVS